MHSYPARLGTILLLLINEILCLSVKMWRQKCADDFGLVEQPGAATLAALSSDEETWKRYHEFRSRLEKETSIEEIDEDDDKTGILQQFRQALQEEADEVHYDAWVRHTFQSVDNLQWELPGQEIRSMTACATIFSPYLIPHAVELEHRYYCRPRFSWCEFYCYWHFRLKRFDGEPNGDDVQQKLSQRYPKDVILLNPTYVADDEMEVLCSNGFKDPPTIEEDVGWVAVEDIDVHNFIPNTIRRIRQWLFGSQSLSQVLTDFDFLRLLFGSFGTAGFQILHGDVGHSWSIGSDLHAQLIQDGVVENNDEIFQDFTGLNWLEYQARLVAGALRPYDKYYVPYDLIEAKSEWGLKVLEACEPGKYKDDDDEDLSEMPWLVWERAEKTSATMRMAMQIMTQLAYRQQQS